MLYEVITPGSGDAACGGVGAGDETGFLQVGHHIADGSRREFQPGKLGQGPRANGGAVGNVVLDQGFEQGA